MKLSLVFPSWHSEFGIYKSAVRKASTFPPLNLCIVAALAEQAGWEVQLIDAHIEQLSHQSLVQKVADFHPDLIGLTATTPYFHNASAVAHTLKEGLNVPIMIGGTHVSICRENAFEDCFDYLVIGECEGNIPDFFTEFAKGKRFPNVKGIMMRRDGEIFYHGDVPLLDDLNKAPLPARHLLPNEKYFLGTPRGTKHYTSLQMSRGCPFSCVFCAYDLHGKRFRIRSVNNVIEELRLVINKYGAQHIYFIDDTLTLNRKFIMDLCDEIEKHNLKFTFEGSTRANLWDERMVKRLKDCGLIRISFGLETADPKVRKIIKKNVPLESYIEANRLNKRLGIETINSAIIGLPGDTRESIENTINFLSNSREVNHVTLNIAIPYPGTEMLKMAENGLYGLKLVERDFSKYQRYESAVMDVNGISSKELVVIQKKALIRIYSRWWRIIPLLKRLGVSTVILIFIATISKFLKSFTKKNT